RAIDGLQFVARQTAAVRRVYQTYIPLRSAIEQRLVVELMINSNQPRVLMHSCGGGGRKLVSVGVGGRGLESCVRIRIARSAAADGASGGSPRVALHDGAHLRARGQNLLLECRRRD